MSPHRCSPASLARNPCLPASKGPFPAMRQAPKRSGAQPSNSFFSMPCALLETPFKDHKESIYLLFSLLRILPARSSALFCRCSQVKSLVFMRPRPLCKKHPGGGYPRPFKNHEPYHSRRTGVDSQAQDQTMSATSSKIESPSRGISATVIVLGLVCVILRAPFWLPLAAILAAALIPAIYSLTFYKQLERRGAL